MEVTQIRQDTELQLVITLDTLFIETVKPVPFCCVSGVTRK